MAHKYPWPMLQKGRISLILILSLVLSGCVQSATAAKLPTYRDEIGLTTIRDNISVIDSSNAAGQPAAPLAPPAGVPKLVDFEDQAVGSSLFNQYDSLVFRGGDMTNFDGSPTVKVVQPAVATASPTRALAAQFQTTCEFGCGSHMTMAFAVPQQRVSLSTGLPALQPGTTGVTMELAGFTTDPGSGAVINGTPIVRSVASDLCSATGPTPLTHPLEIDDPAGRINFAVLAAVACTDENNLDSGPGPNGTFINMDNLLYNRALHPPAGEHNPPVITLTNITSGSIITGSSPGSLFLEVQARVVETALAQMTAQLNGGAPVLMSFYHTDPNTYSAGMILSGLDGLAAGANTLVVKALDFDHPQNTASVTINFTYRIKPYPPPSPVDIWPTAYEVNQSIDSGPKLFYDFELSQFGYEVHVQDPVLVTGKPAMIRIYAGATGTTSPVNKVPADMDVSLDNCTSNCQIASGLPPLLSLATPNLSGLQVNPLNSPAGSPGSALSSLNKTWNFMLQPAWTLHDLVVTIQVNGGDYIGLPHLPPVPECQSGIIGQCFFNNQIKLHLHFKPAPVITVTPILIHVTGTFHGKTFNDIHPTDAEVNNIFTDLNELYPAVVNRGADQSITISPGISKDDLLDKIKDFYGLDPCMAAAFAHNFFLGILPANQAGFDLGPNEKGSDGTFTAGYATVGVPFCGSPGAWADSNDPIDPAHELGHNIGFDHWACENGVTDDECGVFPIAHGGIGGVGVDMVNFRLIPPGDNTTNATPHAHDFMTYGQLCDVPGNGGGPGCDLGEWSSWYTYNILLDHNDMNSYDTDDPPARLVSGRISPAGVATFRPSYRISTSAPITDSIIEDDPDFIYTLQGFDANGNTLFVHNFEPAKLDVHNADYAKDLVFDQPVPAMPNLVKLEVLHGIQVLGTLTDSSPGQDPTVTIHAPQAGATWPVGSSQVITWEAHSPANAPLAAVVQYSPNGGATRITLGRDITGNSLTVDPDQLAGSTNAFIYVEVSDGMKTASAQVGPFTVAPKPPVVKITFPSNHGFVTEHTPITLKGTAYDRQETLSDSQFIWTSSRDGILGVGHELTLARGLSQGQHTLTLTVIDSQGRRASAQVVVQALPPFNIFLPIVQRH